MWVSGSFPMKMEPKAIEKTLLVTSASDQKCMVSCFWLGWSVGKKGCLQALTKCPSPVTAPGAGLISVCREPGPEHSGSTPGRSDTISAGACPWPVPAEGGAAPGLIMVSALQWELRKDPVLWVRSTVHTYFFFFPYSQAVLLETALEIGAPLAGVLLYQVPASDISALQ